MYPHILIHSVQMCVDGIRDSGQLSCHEMNFNYNHRNSIKAMEEKKWQIDEINLDYFRMSNSYLAQFFKVFFNNIKKLSTSKVFRCNPTFPTKMPVIYLPFCPHLFVGIHKHEILKLYDIAYLTDIDILDNRNKLYRLIQSIINLLVMCLSWSWKIKVDIIHTHYSLYSNLNKVYTWPMNKRKQLYIDVKMWSKLVLYG